MILFAVGQQQDGLAVVFDDFGGNDGFFYLRQVGQAVHGFQQGAFDDGTQAARAGLAGHGQFGDGAQCVRFEFQFRAFHGEQCLILFDQGIFRLGEDVDQGIFIQLGQGCNHGQAAD